MSDTMNYLFKPHVNVEFGRVRSYSRFVRFAAGLVAVSVVRLPLDLIALALAFYLGTRAGW